MQKPNHLRAVHEQTTALPSERLVGGVAAHVQTVHEASIEGGLAVIWPLLGRHIAFHRRLVDLTDSVKAALLLSQALYWHRRGRDIHLHDGWFHKTAEQWTLETGLSVKEQQTARDQLRALSLLQDQRMGLPARMHYRLNLDELGARLHARLLNRQDGLSGEGEGHGQGLDWSDRMVLAECLGPAVAFHRNLAGLAGGVHAGLLLSRALHLMRLQARRQLALWVDGSVARWHQELGLSRRAQEVARRDLLALGLWEERLDGIPPSMWARVPLESLRQRLLEVGASRLPVGGNTAFRGAPKGETRMWESRNPVSPKPPSLFSQKRHHSFAESAVPYIELSTSELLQPQPPALARVAEGHDKDRGGGELIFPEQLLPAEREAARRLLGQLPPPLQAQAQVLLDELTGRLQTQGVRHPLAYLRSLVQRATSGQFVPELASRVAAERQRIAEDVHTRRVQVRVARERAAAQASLRSQPDYQQRVLASRQRARDLLAEMKQSLGSQQARRSSLHERDPGPAGAHEAEAPSHSRVLPVSVISPAKE